MGCRWNRVFGRRLAWGLFSRCSLPPGGFCSASFKGALKRRGCGQSRGFWSMREPTWWVNKFFAYPTRKRAKSLSERGCPDDIYKVLYWLSDAYEAALRYPPCAEVCSVEELREQLKRHGIPPPSSPGWGESFGKGPTWRSFFLARRLWGPGWRLSSTSPSTPRFWSNPRCPCRCYLFLAASNLHHRPIRRVDLRCRGSGFY